MITKYDRMKETYEAVKPILTEEIKSLYKNLYQGFNLTPDITLNNNPVHIGISVSSINSTTKGVTTDGTEKLIQSKFSELTKIVNGVANEHGLKRKTLDGNDGFYFNGIFLTNHPEPDSYMTLIFK